MSRRSFGWLRASAAALGLFAAAPAVVAQPTAANPQTVTMWSHWPDEASNTTWAF